MSNRPFSALLSAALFFGISSAIPGAHAMTRPGISHSQADLDRMKNNINVEPYKTAFAAFSSLGYSSSTNTGQGPFTYETYGHGQFEIRNDAEVCHYNAIMWYVTGNKAYLTNAITIMMGWANTLTAFDVTDHITAGTAIFDFANAAEILRATGNGAWPSSQITTFQNWMITYLYPPLLTPGNSIAANQLEAAGHGGLQIKGLVSLGIFCDRADIYNFGISSVLHNGSYSYGLEEYINSGGQNYETQRDQGHASGNVGTFAQTFYMAWNQGTDLFKTDSNLLALGFESQAKIDLLYNVAPAVWTSADSTTHNSIANGSRSPYDNLTSDTAYYIFHTVKGLNMPYTKMSADIQFPDGGASFLYRVDSTGQVPLAPLYGYPNPADVVLFADGYYSGQYLVHIGAGSFTNAKLNAAGVVGGQWGNGSNTLSSLQVPAGWTVTLYSGDNFTGNSVAITSTTSDLSTIGWNDGMVSLKVTAGSTPYQISNGTYRIVSVNSSKVADIKGASTSSGAGIVQTTYSGAMDQLWRVEGQGGGQYRFLNLNSKLAMEVPGASVGSTALDQLAYVALPDVATGGTATASADNAGGGEGAAQAFDGTSTTKWFDPITGGTGWLQYQFGSGKKSAITTYTMTSANDTPQRDPAAWQFQGSNDGLTWVTLDTQTGQVFANRFQSVIYNLANTTAYGYYRLNVTANAGGSGYGIQLSELALYSLQTGAPNQRWTFAPVTGSAFGSSFLVKNVNSGLVLYVSGNSTANGAALFQWPSTGVKSQQWLLQVP